jgi:hypothetical protein
MIHPSEIKSKLTAFKERFQADPNKFSTLSEHYLDFEELVILMAQELPSPVLLNLALNLSDNLLKAMPHDDGELTFLLHELLDVAKQGNKEREAELCHKVRERAQALKTQRHISTINTPLNYLYDHVTDTTRAIQCDPVEEDVVMQLWLRNALTQWWEYYTLERLADLYKAYCKHYQQTHGENTI